MLNRKTTKSPGGHVKGHSRSRDRAASHKARPVRRRFISSIKPTGQARPPPVETKNGHSKVKTPPPLPQKNPKTLPKTLSKTWPKSLQKPLPKSIQKPLPKAPAQAELANGAG